MLVEKYLQKQLSTLPEPLTGCIRDVQSLLRLARLRTLVFSSTTLLSNNMPVVSQYFAMQNQTLATKQEVLQIAGSLAACSRVPLFRAITNATREAGLPLWEIDADQKKDGIIGKLERTWYVLGNEACMQAEAIDLGMTSQVMLQQLESEGKQILILAQKQPKRLLAIFACDVPLDPQASAVVEELQKLGLELVILTGEKTRIARGMLHPLHLELLHSELSPEEKQEVLRTLARQHMQLGVYANNTTLSLVPESALTLLQGRRMAASAHVVIRRLGDLPLLIIWARQIQARAQKLFFWSKL